MLKLLQEMLTGALAWILEAENFLFLIFAFVLAVTFLAVFLTYVELIFIWKLSITEQLVMHLWDLVWRCYDDYR